MMTMCCPFTIKIQVLIVAMIDGTYHLFDPFHAGDCQAVPYMYLLKEDPSHIYTTRTVMYNILQEVGR